MYKFNASFRKSAAAVATEMGLEFVSTKRQVENGTLMFYDPKTKTKYAMYESGYVRRLYKTSSWGVKTQHVYQLNKTRKDYKTTVFNGKTYTSYQTVRILANPEEQLGILVKSVVNFRNK